MCCGSVQARLVTSLSSWSASCMKGATFWPSPTGSSMVKRSLPGGMVASRRSITACKFWLAAALATPAASNSRLRPPMSGASAGKVTSLGIAGAGSSYSCASLTAGWAGTAASTGSELAAG